MTPCWCGEHRTRRTAYVCPWRIVSSIDGFRISQHLIVLSTDAVTSRFGLYLFQSQLSTSKSWAGMVCVDICWFVSHSFTVRSPAQEASA